MREIRSDRGTNIVGAEKELKKALDEMDHRKVFAENTRPTGSFNGNRTRLQHPTWVVYGRGKFVQFVPFCLPCYENMAVPSMRSPLEPF